MDALENEAVLDRKQFQTEKLPAPSLASSLQKIACEQPEFQRRRLHRSPDELVMVGS